MRYIKGLILEKASFRRSELPKLAKETVTWSIGLHWSFSQSDRNMNDRNAPVSNKMRAMQLSVLISLYTMTTAVYIDTWVAGDPTTTATPIGLCENGGAS